MAWCEIQKTEEALMGCLSCGRGFHFECEKGCVNCHPDYEKVVQSLTRIGNSGNGKGAPTKNPEDVKDKFSTGRKRAAHLWPLFRNNPCDWQGKKNCGGGIPIVGCLAGKQQARHHGPVKQVLRNEPGNVHRICHVCHNRWHTINDKDYDEEKWDETEHKPEAAKELDLLANEAYWKLRPLKIIGEDDDY